MTKQAIDSNYNNPTTNPIYAYERPSFEPLKRFNDQAEFNNHFARNNKISLFVHKVFQAIGRLFLTAIAYLGYPVARKVTLEQPSANSVKHLYFGINTAHIGSVCGLYMQRVKAIAERLVHKDVTIEVLSYDPFRTREKFNQSDIHKNSSIIITMPASCKATIFDRFDGDYASFLSGLDKKLGENSKTFTTGAHVRAFDNHPLISPPHTYDVRKGRGFDHFNSMDEVLMNVFREDHVEKLLTGLQVPLKVKSREPGYTLNLFG